MLLNKLGQVKRGGLNDNLAANVVIPYSTNNTMASSNQIQVVLPGDTVPCFATSNSSESSDSTSKATVKLGPGLLQNPESNEQIIAIKCGVLRHNSGSSVEKWWIDGNQRRVSGSFSTLDLVIMDQPVGFREIQILARNSGYVA